MRNYTTVTLATYSILATAWLSVCFYENKLQQETHEHIILEYEKVLLEYEVDSVMKCEGVEVEIRVEDEGYTYDMWISSEPCPSGKTGPLCHMKGPEEL